MSGSDGQRSPAPVKSRHTTAIPRYFGFNIERDAFHGDWNYVIRPRKESL
jgi:hypothetical protein